MKDNDIDSIKDLVNRSLDQAERHWRNGGYKLIAESSLGMESFSKSAMDAAPSRIPGYEFIMDGETIVDEFIAIVIDMRGSTKHLLNADNSTALEGIQRVFYETSALLPAVEKTINIYNGGITEYLGDGVLGFFKRDKDNPDKAIYNAHDAAKDCLNTTLNLVNAALETRYGLTPLVIGVGMALSKALISLSGIDGVKHPKAYGECVFRATKLSGGQNIVLVDERLKNAWPKKRGGVLKFMKSEIGKGGVTGFKIIKK
ncbi:TPA: adenylate/guanylate cyclase [Citrobacter amalonaticus]